MSSDPGAPCFRTQGARNGRSGRCNATTRLGASPRAPIPLARARGSDVTTADRPAVRARPAAGARGRPGAGPCGRCSRSPCGPLACGASGSRSARPRRSTDDDPPGAHLGAGTVPQRWPAAHRSAASITRATARRRRQAARSMVTRPAPPCRGARTSPRSRPMSFVLEVNETYRWP
jgi:hypothetical protein